MARRRYPKWVGRGCFPLRVQSLEDRLTPSGTAYLPPSRTIVNESALGAVDLRATTPLDAVRSYLEAHAVELGVTRADVSSAIVTAQYTDADTGITHIYLRQQAGGLEVANADFAVSVLANGSVYTVAGGFIYDLANRVSPASPDSLISPADAVRSGARQLGLELSENPKPIDPVVGPVRSHAFDAPSVSTDPVTAKLRFVPTSGGSAALAWEIVLHTPDGQHWYDADIDARTGSILALADWIDNDAYQVVPLPNESPQDGGLASVTAPADLAASPFGWHDTNGIAGPENTDTRGNNVDAHLDRDNNNSPDSGSRPSGGSALDFSNYTFDPSSSPFTTQNQRAAVVNLFYTINRLHDLHYKYGFTEAAGNFQINNYGKGGFGNDAVQGDAQDGGGTNNANFGTPPDGSAPRMQQYIWTAASPDRDSDLDNGVIMHEYGHGVSNRLTGGPANSGALNATQSGGMGEGWSDFYALMFTQKPTYSQNAGYGIGTYVQNQPQSGGGIRRFRYSYDMAINPLTWDAYGSSGTTSYGVARSTAVHRTGEIWCSTLWDLNWLLINKYGYDPDVSTGWSAAAGPAHAGNKLMLRLVMEGMKLQPANPSFADARDAILAADVAINGGADQYEIWSAFARRGLGVDAVNPSSSDTTITAGFAMPSGIPNFSVVGIAPANASVQSSAPSSYTLTLSAAVDPTSIQASDLVVNGIAATGFSYTPGNLSIGFTFNINPVTAQGTQNVTVAGGAIARGGDSLGVFPFNSFFRYDTLPLQVTSFSPAPGSTNSLPFTTVDLNFNEALAPASVSVGDLTLSQGYVASVALLDGDKTARFTLASITHEGPLTVSLLAGSVTDVNGNPTTAAFSANYELDFVSRAFGSTFTASPPLGSRVYQASTTGMVNNGTDIDDLTLAIDAGQTLSLVVTPEATLRSRVQLRSPTNSVLADVIAPSTGAALVVPPNLLNVGGTYTIRVMSTSGTSGDYTVQATLNAAPESESIPGGAANNTAATAQILTNSAVSVSTPFASSTRMAAAGVLDAPGGYAVSSPAYSFEDIAATGATILTDVDDAYFGVALPFSFRFYGANYSTAYVSSNGLISFDSGTTAYSNGDLTTSPGVPTVAAFWDDLVTTAADGVKWQVLGSAGSRRLVVQWQNVRFYDGPSETLQFQAVLFEGTNEIRINYANLSTGTAGHDEGDSASVGVKDNAGNRVLLANGDGPNAYVASGKSILLSPIAPSADWYSFTASAGQTISVVTSSLTGGVPTIQLIAPDGVTPLASGAPGATNLGTMLQNFVIPAGGTYFVAVGSDVVLQNYTLSVVTNAAFDAEPNDSAATAQPLGNSRAAHGYMSVSGGDWYQVTIPAGHTVLQVETATPADGPGEFTNVLNPLLRVYNVDGSTLLGSGIVLGDGRNETLTLGGLTPGATYAIRLDGTSQSTGEYVLGLSTKAASPARVASVVIGDGTSQRSLITQLVVNFDQSVSLPANPADAFQLNQLGGSTVGLVAVANSNPATAVTITFTGGAVDGASLADGRYSLAVLAAQVNNGLFDGNGDGTPGDNFILASDPSPNPPSNIFRLFGDVNGDAHTDNVDFVAFRSANGSDSTSANWNPNFDSDGDGFIDNDDFVAFRQRIGVTI